MVQSTALCKSKGSCSPEFRTGKDVPFLGVQGNAIASIVTNIPGPRSPSCLLIDISDQNKDVSITYSKIRSAVNCMPSAYMDGLRQHIVASF